MAYVKQNWENLPSTNTPITAERLNHMEDGISEAWEHGGGAGGETLPVGSEIDFDGQSADIPTGWEQISNPDEYSTTEIKTNKIWVDGKPIYKKVVYIASLPNNTTTSYNHGCQNVDKIWVNTGMSFIYWSSTNATAPLNYLSVTTGTVTYNAMIEIRALGATTFDIITGTDRTGQSAWITLCYTKTTD